MYTKDYTRLPRTVKEIHWLLRTTVDCKDLPENTLTTKDYSVCLPTRTVKNYWETVITKEHNWIAKGYQELRRTAKNFEEQQWQLRPTMACQELPNTNRKYKDYLHYIMDCQELQGNSVTTKDGKWMLKTTQNTQTDWLLWTTLDHQDLPGNTSITSD